MPLWLENATPTSAGDALYRVLQVLTSSTTSNGNWTVRTSGSGIGGVYAQTGNVIPSAAILETDLAWFVVRGHVYTDLGITYRQEICAQVNAVGQVRLKVSPRAGFVAGSPSEMQTPAALDEQILLGGGTDAAPTFETLFPVAGARLQGFVSEANDAFWFLSYPVGGGLPTTLWFLDLPQTIYIDSSGGLRDKTPWLHYARAGASCALQDDVGREDRAARSVYRYGTSQELWGRSPALAAYSLDNVGNPQRVFPAGTSTSNLFATPSYPQAEVRYLRRAGLAGTLLTGENGDSNTTDDKGYSSLFHWAGTLYANPQLLDAVNPQSGAVSSNTVLAAGHLLLCWSGTAIQV